MEGNIGKVNSSINQQFGGGRFGKTVLRQSADDTQFTKLRQS
jgi:hypothetical protein